MNNSTLSTEKAWFEALPLIHFLRNNSRPFDPMELDPVKVCWNIGKDVTDLTPIKEWTVRFIYLLQLYMLLTLLMQTI